MPWAYVNLSSSETLIPLVKHHRKAAVPVSFQADRWDIHDPNNWVQMSMPYASVIYIHLHILSKKKGVALLISSRGKNEVMPFVFKWMQLEIIMLS